MPCEAGDCTWTPVAVLSMMGTDSLDGVTVVCVVHLTHTLIQWLKDPEDVEGWTVQVYKP